VAGYTSRVWHTLLLDLIHVAEQLEELGFTYYKGKVIIVEPKLEKSYV
jgi:hypothetical protein